MLDKVLAGLILAFGLAFCTEHPRFGALLDPWSPSYASDWF